MAAQKRTCAVVRGGRAYEGKQGLAYFEGVSAESVGATGLSLQRLVMPPGARAKAHFHEAHESAVFVVSGEGEMWFGNDLEDYVRLGPGDFLYVPPGVPHLPGNPSGSEECVAVIARTDPNEQESVVVLERQPDNLERPQA